MEILKPRSVSNHQNQDKPYIILIGLGLIGDSILKRLLGTGSYISLGEIPLDWNHRDSLRDSMASAMEIVSREAFKESSISSLVVIWAAGRAGFSAGSEQTSSEFVAFQSMANEIVRKKVMADRINFILFSSAGGLYEGQTNIDEDSRLTIRRPYGRLKLNQEAYVSNLEEISRIFIIRPSAVFGGISTTKRMGLIPTMIFNGLSYQVTDIVGSPHTLRDFVWVEDVARFVENLVIKIDELGEKRVNKYILASGKPSSIFEIKTKIESLLQRSLLISYKGMENSLHMTYLKPSMLPFWSPTPEGEAISRVYYDWMASGTLKEKKPGSEEGAKRLS